MRCRTPGTRTQSFGIINQFVPQDEKVASEREKVAWVVLESEKDEVEDWFNLIKHR
ncbi:hypothetical protein RUM43_009735, partial [Polyplax serrata]